MIEALKRHWPEYLMETGELAIFMVVAGSGGTLIEYEGSPIRQAVADPVARRLLMGIVMGLTAIAIIYSPWGRQSGAHLNPAVTLTFWRLGKVESWDAIFYVAAQFVGGSLGVLLVAAALGGAFADPPVIYIATVPGPDGPGLAFLAELAISFGLMTVVLLLTNTPRLARFTGLIAGLLIVTFITVEAPLSGMSMNPARTFASALLAQLWATLWIYFLAPPLGMLLAAQIYTWRHDTDQAVVCAKLDHDHSRRCIFRCGYRQAHRASVKASRATPG